MVTKGFREDKSDPRPTLHHAIGVLQFHGHPLFSFGMAVPVYHPGKVCCSVISPHIWETRPSPYFQKMQKLKLKVGPPMGPKSLNIELTC